MNIAAFDIYQYALDLTQPLIVRGHSIDCREGFIIRLRSEEGEEGFGEIAPLPGFSTETLSEACAQLKIFKTLLVGQTIPEKVEACDGQFHHWFNDANLKPSVRFGMEGAVLHLLASARNISLSKLLSNTTRSEIKITGLLYGSTAQVVEQALQLIDSGFTDLKLKVGSKCSGSFDADVTKVHAVNKAVCGKAILHLDANQTWSFDQAVKFGKAVGCSACSYLEEPFADIHRIPEFFDQTMIPVALDESLTRFTIEEIKSITGIKTLGLKPTMLGGIEKTRQIIKQVEHCPLNTIISSSFESSVGLLTLANLAGSSVHGDIAGLDTLKWFKTDVLKQPVLIQNGTIAINEQRIQTENINYECLKKVEG